MGSNQLTGLVPLSPAVGMVGPLSNYAALAQLIKSVPYQIAPHRTKTPEREERMDCAAVEQFVADFRERNRGKWLDSARLGGYCCCCCCSSEVLRRVTTQGQLDKWTDQSHFDTKILSDKAKEAGFAVAGCRDLVIHQFGTRTFTHGRTAPTGPG